MRAQRWFVIACSIAALPGCHRHGRDAPKGGGGSAADNLPWCARDAAPNESGCFRAVSRSDGDELQFSHPAYPVSVITRHAGATSTTTVTLAGVTTWSSVVERADSGGLARWTLSELSPSTGALVRDQVWTPDTGDAYRAVSRELAAEAPEVHEFAVPRVMHQTGSVLPHPGAPPIQTENCAAAETSKLETELHASILQGFRCMRDRGRPDIGTQAFVHYHDGPIHARCGRSGGDSRGSFDAAMAVTDEWWVPQRVKNLRVDKSLFQKSDGFQRRTLWHEWLHTVFPATADHNDLENVPASTEVDRVFACTSLCFDGAAATRCACALCLETTPCDPRCASLAPCVTRPEPDCGWKYQEITPLGTFEGTKCRGLGGDWVVTGELSVSSQGFTVTSSVRETVTIDEQTRAGTFRYEVIQTSPFVLVTGTATGSANIIVNDDGSVTMTRSPATYLLVSTSSGNQVSITTQLPGATYHWQSGSGCAAN